MRVSVLVPTWRRPGSLERCLDGLERQHRAPDEVIVVVRDSDKETKEWLERRAPGLRNLSVETLSDPGVVAALNRGLAAVGGDIVAITDDDAVPRRDWLARIERHFSADPGIGAVGGRDWLHPASQEAEQTTVGILCWYGRLIGNHHLGVDGPRQVDVLKGVNMSFRRTALAGARVDKRLRGAGAQTHWEIDLCSTVKQAGWTLVYDPAVSVDHYPAERFEDDTRTGAPTGVTLEHAVHNETYLVMKWLPWWRRTCALVYWSVVGTRAAPGLVALVERMLRESDRKAVLRRFISAQRGRRQGIRTFAGARSPIEGT
jgi:cellulose synthase/poly-beta-1,6-N-acetylglucosamine synthase-like glycosyltransferase